MHEISILLTNLFLGFIAAVQLLICKPTTAAIEYGHILIKEADI